MILVVTGIGFLIHVYAIGYMEGDPRYGRFFAYLNLFVFFMLLLVLADNYLLLYVGWEGVGLCSYLLIGFWFEKTENAIAAKKAFVTTRIGDTMMLVGLALIVKEFGSLDFGAVLGAPGETIGEGTATAISLLLFAGAIGKSAQVPLHVWLPDAMAGPTPVSALIHAATMVTAGVYLVVQERAALRALRHRPHRRTRSWGSSRCSSPRTCALAQDDIKRVLAYSTISQLGFMFMAAGMRFYTGAIFMLVAHAFYKALMFLGAGSVMHGTHEETDLQRMGGLIRRMPVTGWTFLLGAFALAGVWPLAGFFAKDQILEVANRTGRTWVYLLGTLGALLSALYIGRLLFLAFFGRPRSEQAEHAHESPVVMTDPARGPRRGRRSSPGSCCRRTPRGGSRRRSSRWSGRCRRTKAGLSTAALLVIATAIALGALAVAWWVYASGRVDWLALRERLQPLPRAARNGWYVDQRVLHAVRTARARRGPVLGERLRHEGRRRARERGRRRDAAVRRRCPPHPDRVRALLRARVPPRRRRRPRLAGDAAVNKLLTLTTFLPLLGALMVLGGGRGLKDGAARWVALGVSVATFIVSLVVLGRFDPSSSETFQMVEIARWVPSIGLSYAVGIDGLSIWMLLLTTFLFPVSILASWTITKDVRRYLAAILVLETAVIGTFVALDLLLFFLFFEALLVPMYLLIGGWGGQRRIYAAIKFFLFTMAGSAFLLVAILFLYVQQDGPRLFGYGAMMDAAAGVPVTTARWLFLAFFVAFAVKVPLVPLHTWLPDAHTEAPTAGSVLLAALLLKVGTYGLIRFNLMLFPEASKYFATFVGVIAVIGIVYGAVNALIQTDIKRLVAYSSVSHLGFVVLGVFAFTQQGVTGGVLQMVNHGLATGALFLLVGMVYERTHTRDLGSMGGLASVMPWLMGAFLFTVFASAGLPGLNGFVGEFLVIVGTFAVHSWFGALAATAVVLAAIYLLWSYQRMAFGPVREEHRSLPDVSLREVVVLAPVLALLLVFGVAPKLLTDRIDPATEAVIARVAPNHQTDVGVADRAIVNPSADEEAAP